MGAGEVLTIVVGGTLTVALSPILAIFGALLSVARCATRNVGYTTTRQRAAVYDHKAPDCIRIVDTARRPKLRSGFVVVKIHAAGVNPVDAKAIIGDKFPESWMPFWFKRVTGLTVGFDFSGEVVQATAKSKHKPGDLVYGLNYQYLPKGLGKFGGTLQEYALVPEHEIWKKPESLSHVEAAALPLVGLTCLQAFEQHGLKPGQRLLVVGASGGVGHVATAIASRVGVDVTGICSTGNVEFVKSMGANQVLDYRATKPIMEQVSAEAAEKGQFDMVFDTVSSADSRDIKANYEQQIRALDPPAIKLWASRATKTVSAEQQPVTSGTGPVDSRSVDKHNYVVFGGRMISWWRALVKRLTRKAGCTVNFFPRGFELFWIDMPDSTSYLQTLQVMCDDQGMRPKVTQAVAFTDEGVQAAFHALNPPPGERRGASGKIVVEVIPAAISGGPSSAETLHHANPTSVQTSDANSGALVEREGAPVRAAPV